MPKNNSPTIFAVATSLVASCLALAQPLFAATLAQPVCSVFSRSYAVKDLGQINLPDTTFQSPPFLFRLGMNAAGFVAGELYGINHASVSRGDPFVIDLTPNLGPNLTAAAVDINANNQIAGNIYNGAISSAFIWESGAFHTLPNLPNMTDSVARNINSSGDIVGNSYSNTGLFAATLWPHGGSPVALPLGYDAADINRNGEIAGFSSLGPTLWDANHQPHGLGTGLGRALALNDNGAVVGYTGYYSYWSTPNPAQATLWKNGVATLLGPPVNPDNQSMATGINKRGAIVGMVVSRTADNQPFLFEENHYFKLEDLVPASFVPALRSGLAFTREINDRSQITLGSYVQIGANYEYHAYRLDPVCP